MAFYGIYEFLQQTALEVMDVEHGLGRQLAFKVSVLVGLMFALIIIIMRLKSRRNKNVPPGSLGFPLIGETFGFVGAMKADIPKDWIDSRVAKYGPIFKTSLMGCPTVVMTGQAGNKFLFTNDYKTVVNKQPATVSRIMGKYNLLEVSVEDHKRLRGALMSFLKPEALQKSVGKMDTAIQRHLDKYWKGKESVRVVPLMKRLTFGVACSLLFSLEECEDRETLMQDFTIALKGVWSLPLDFPGTAFRRGLNARSRLCKHLSALIEMRRKEVHEGKASPRQDLISCLLTIKDETNQPLTTEEIIDNIIVVLIASHDTTSILLALLVKVLAMNPNIYDKIAQEQKQILERKQPDEALTWEDVQQMKYTWRVAQESLRLTSPVFGGFRKTVKDIEYGGYAIPKGWQLFWVTSSTHMNEDIFAEPHKFNPSRFDGQTASLPPYTFVPFGGGTRVCPGYDFAKVETLLAIHHLVTTYRWSTMIPDEPVTRDPMPYPAMGLPIKLKVKKE
eukprot:Gb_33310 [translate_table: standard]